MTTTQFSEDDLFARPYPPLHPDLRHYLDTSHEIACLRHPLVYSIPHSEALNRFTNRQYEQKTALVADAAARDDWEAYVSLHERPWRTNVVHQLAYEFGVLDDQTFWGLVSHAWIDTENIDENADLWQDLWTDPRPGRDTMMTGEELDYLRGLPNLVPVYRGTNGRDVATHGRSWTLSTDVAHRFAQRSASLYDGTPTVLRLLVKRSAIVALFTRRREAEVVLDMSAVDWNTLATLPQR